MAADARPSTLGAWGAWAGVGRPAPPVFASGGPGAAYGRRQVPAVRALASSRAPGRRRAPLPLGALAAQCRAAPAAGRRDGGSLRSLVVDRAPRGSEVGGVSWRIGGPLLQWRPGRGGWAPFAATIAVKSAHPPGAAGTCAGLRAVGHGVVSALRGSTRAARPRARARRTCHLGGEFFDARARARTTARAPRRPRLRFLSMPRRTAPPTPQTRGPRPKLARRNRKFRRARALKHSTPPTREASNRPATVGRERVS
jgi:hypothetical protein